MFRAVAYPVIMKKLWIVIIHYIYILYILYILYYVYIYNIYIIRKGLYNPIPGMSHIIINQQGF